LNISLDSATPEVHDSLRGLDGCFQAAVDGARRSREHGIFTGVSTYATSENLASGALEDLIRFSRDQGFHEVTIFDCIPSGKFLHRTDFILSDEEKEEIIEVGNRFHRADHPMGVVVMAKVNSPLGAGCFGGFTQMYITAFGDVNPCDFNPISFGNVREFPLEAIWEKMVTHPEYGVRSQTCRMQSPRYRRRYVEPIPEGTPLPVPIEALPGDGTFDSKALERVRKAGGEGKSPYVE
jgi:MoaA/NifB/PqqE/SkfB family radical SAM enzyme